MSEEQVKQRMEHVMLVFALHMLTDEQLELLKKTTEERMQKEGHKWNMTMYFGSILKN